MTDTITKPLVWVEVSSIPHHKAKTPFGGYYIEYQGKDEHSHRYLLTGVGVCIYRVFPTLDAAQSAAQADYDTRARAMLSDETLAKLDEADRLRAAVIDLLASLVAAVSLLKRSPKKAAPSDKMFDLMVADYEGAINRARAALSKAEGRS